MLSKRIDVGAHVPRTTIETGTRAAFSGIVDILAPVREHPRTEPGAIDLLILRLSTECVAEAGKPLEYGGCVKKVRIAA